MVTEKHLTIAYKLIQCRDAARRLYAGGWKTKIEEWRPIIQAVMREQKTDEVLQAAIVLGKQLEGIPLMTCLGVIMEIMEEKIDLD